MVKDSFSFKLWYSSCIYYLEGTNSKIMCLPIFRNITEIVNMVLGDAVTKLQRFVWLFNHVSRVITWSLFNLRAPNLVKWPISTWPFIWSCQFIDSFKFETCPSSLHNFKMANSEKQTATWPPPQKAKLPVLKFRLGTYVSPLRGTQ